MNLFSLEDNECIGITKSNTQLKILGHSDEIEVPGGEIIKILRLAKFGIIFIKLYSVDKRNLILSELTYSCDQNAIKILNVDFGSMLMTIGDRSKRLLICNNSDYERFLVNLKLNDVVKVNKFLFKRDHHLICVVKYIGNVPEIGPGTFVGCKLYDETRTIDERNNIAGKYFDCNQKNGFIRNCGCFFTRSMLLDQNIDNLLRTINKTKDKNLNEPKFVNVNATITFTPVPFNKTKETNMFNKPPSISTVTQPMEPEQSTSTSNSTASYKPNTKPLVLGSAKVYPDERRTTTSYIPPEQFFSTPSKQSSTAHRPFDMGSFNSTPSHYSQPITLQPKVPEPPPPKKKGCCIM